MISVVELLGQSTGGIRKHVAALAEHLDDAQFDVSYIAGPGVLDEFGIAADEITIPTAKNPQDLRQARNALLRSCEHADIVHAHGLRAALVLGSISSSAKKIVTLHNVVLGDATSPKVRLLRAFERRIISTMDYVICASPEIYNTFGPDIDAATIDMILPASPDPVIERTRQEVRAKWGIADDATVVINVSRLHPQKDLPTFISAVAPLIGTNSNTHVVMVGIGPLQHELEAQCTSLGIRNAVHFVGQSDNAANEIAAADCFALTARWEAIPFVVREAIQLGVPVVSTKVGIVEEMLGTNETMVSVGDVVGFRSTLEHVLNNLNDATQNATQIAAQYATHSSNAALVQSVEAVYQHVAKT